MTSAAKPRPERICAVHLDAVGGISGDMFSAALLDARPDLWPTCQRAMDALGLPEGIRVSLAGHRDRMLAGSRFIVEGVEAERARYRDPGGLHGASRWTEIRARIVSASLDPAVRSAALAIFTALAKAEAAVHGADIDDVTFHEVGADDSIADIVSAAAIIAALGPCRWSIGPIPRGRGWVETAHGVLPVPAPATLWLLEGFVLVDDDEAGERVTPTGAAILRHLAPTQRADPIPRRLIATGVGFGTRTLKRRSNVLRATLFAEAAADACLGGDLVEVLRFEVDDQTGEDLAVALERLRRTSDVIDVCQWPVLAKKGRMAAAVQVLVRAPAADRIVEAVLSETSTLGVRRNLVARTTIERELREAGGIAVKLARRPTGISAKAEMDDLAHVQGIGRRRKERERAERKALAQETPDG